MFESLWDHGGPQVKMEMKGFKERKAAVVVHALCNAGSSYEDRERDGEGSVMRQKQTKERERETWMGTGSVGMMDGD